MKILQQSYRQLLLTLRRKPGERGQKKFFHNLLVAVRRFARKKRFQAASLLNSNPISNQRVIQKNRRLNNRSFASACVITNRKTIGLAERGRKMYQMVTARLSGELRVRAVGHVLH